MNGEERKDQNAKMSLPMMGPGHLSLACWPSKTTTSSWVCARGNQSFRVGCRDKHDERVGGTEKKRRRDSVGEWKKRWSERGKRNQKEAKKRRSNALPGHTLLFGQLCFSLERDFGSRAGDRNDRNRGESADQREEGGEAASLCRERTSLSARRDGEGRGEGGGEDREWWGRE
ncbi:hypothetical protein niasHT_009274 [Heterodera trifolii]|uniref:Uncharacterized protein n=1 Tax=Heterodera trifolii TaxID=157864 RepID=A0ABD2ME44_9BILA